MWFPSLLSLLFSLIWLVDSDITPLPPAVSPPALLSSPTLTAPLLQPPEASRALALLSGPSANARERGGDSEEVPAGFEQDRTISSCVDLWREYKEGIGGAPSVEDMDKKWNARWRRLDKDRVHYKRRMIIINRIKAVIASEKVSAERAVFLVERARLALSTPRSLDKLSKMLRDETFEVALS
ncbi:unnamed protein product [Tilletia controversa]|nr:unnamed protein product [Tilletia controversa]